MSGGTPGVAGGGAGDAELRRKIDEYRAREGIYLAGLMGQESELTRLKALTSDVLGAYGDGSRATLRSSLQDPAANMEVLCLRRKLREKEQQMTHLKEELEANRFDQKLPAGMALMRKCKALLTENKELGDEMGDERMNDFHSALDVERQKSGRLRQKVDEAADFCRELSDEREKLQTTIAKVAGRLRESKAELEVLVRERAEAKKRRKIEKDARGVEAALRASTLAATPEVPSLGVLEQPQLQPSVAPPVFAEADSTAAPNVGITLQPAVDAAFAELPASHKPHKEKKDKKDKTEKKERKKSERAAAAGAAAAGVAAAAAEAA